MSEEPFENREESVVSGPASARRRDERVVPDPTQLDAAGILERKQAVEARLGATKGDRRAFWEREALKAEHAALLDQQAALKAASKVEKQRRNFAGVGSPFHEAVGRRLDATTVAELEHEALCILRAREERRASEKAARTTRVEK